MKKHSHYVIYALIDPFTKELRYIGQTDGFIFDRLDEHLKEPANKFDSQKYDWITSLKNKGREPEVKRLFNCTSQPQANLYERLFIFYWKYILLQDKLVNVNIAKGVNLFNLFSTYPAYHKDLSIIDQYSTGYTTKAGRIKHHVAL